MTPTPPDGTPRLIADQLHRDDGQDRGIRALAVAVAVAVVLAIAAFGALAAPLLRTHPATPSQLPPPIVHVAASACPPAPTCPPCVVACAACPAPPGRHR